MTFVEQDSASERYRLDVMATRIADTVNCAGGWIFDRAMDGWDITVFVAFDHNDARPLEILGAKVADLARVADRPERSPEALSVAADLYATDGRVRYAVRKAFRRRTPEITLWGNQTPPELKRGAVVVQHQLTNAARAFKAHALAAAGIHSGSVDPVETLSRARRNSRVAQDSFDDRHLVRLV
ncbi:hypothetical protein [Mycolicibacterium holsaticum]|uniref:hypothetical protein n=1 Tax=Mycolicibacterium holsaticum TaxID=152142 RepID=UPI001C7D26BA|nr:hypothetical protein [Mycolicibacterium holsaticum]MDA4106785.1 hypothetical protein [Mycolicibacterium holsaticum DSM 44478 = JCM 12374]QZA14093.1 hypothetical protein K3U96_08255 [Mycolicibacterium holsaticum DSM 44478 = JCM 12374]UNC08450.1 hypothetical protein H5U41_18575 [Mycolicibacterium holsaticum DSM 44478 = JCM 12374]